MGRSVSQVVAAIAVCLVGTQSACLAQTATVGKADSNWLDWTINYVSTATKPANSYVATASAAKASAPAPASTVTPVARQSASLPKIFECKSPVSNDFISEINADVAALPEAWKNALCKGGYKITLSKTLTDSVPAAKNQQVRGYKTSATWSQVFGMFDRSKRRVVMAELAKSSEAANAPLVTLNDPQTRAGIVRHEFGHAVDDYLGYKSHSPKFAQAYQAGLKRLTAQDKVILNYYLQAGDAGKEEMFAELFAAMSGNACDPVADQLLRAKFPEAMQEVVAVSKMNPA